MTWNNFYMAKFKIRLQSLFGGIFRMIAFHFSLMPVMSNCSFKVYRNDASLKEQEMEEG